MDELKKEFDFSKVQKGGGTLNVEKLDWLNKEHMKLLPKEEIEKNILAQLPKEMQAENIASKLIPIIFERISKWSDVKDMAERGELGFFFKAPAIDKAKLNFKNTPPEKTIQNLKLVEALGDLAEADFTSENVKDILMKIADALEKRGELLHPIRYALSGLDKSPDPFVIASIIGKNETLSRLQKVT